MKRVFYLLAFIACLVAQQIKAQNELALSENIRVNQIGYYPSAPKTAVIISNKRSEFFIYTFDLKKKVFTGKLSLTKTSPYSDKKTQLADFSAFTQPGSYVLVVSGLGHSYVFDIKQDVHHDVATASTKGFYY